MYEVTSFNYNPPECKDRIESLEDIMLQQEQVDIPERHLFSKGLYCKEIFIPKGTLAIGHAHTEDFIETVSKGHMIMYSPGKDPVEVKAPYTGIGKPFKRKIGFAVEDTIWATYHHTNETDIDKIEEQLIIKSKTWLESKEVESARKDYIKMLVDVGISHEVALKQSQNTNDLTEMPESFNYIETVQSQIEGKGIFCNALFNAGEVICPARINGKRTPAGRYTNHSHSPNCEMVKIDSGDINLVSVRAVGFEELTIDYRQALLLSISEV